MKEYLKKYGVRMGIIVAASAFLILLGAATRSGIGLVQNVTGIVAAPMQKVLSSTVNWFNTIYGYLYEYDSLMAENESLRTQLGPVSGLLQSDRPPGSGDRDPAGGPAAAAEAHRLCAGVCQGGALVRLQLVLVLHHQQGKNQRH